MPKPRAEVPSNIERPIDVAEGVGVELTDCTGVAVWLLLWVCDGDPDMDSV